MPRPNPTPLRSTRRPTLRVVESGQEASPDLSPATIDRALAGDGETMRRLVALLRPAIQAEVAWSLERFAPQGRGRDPRQEVRDTVQEVFVALLENDGLILRRWDPSRGRSLVSFIRLVARHQVASLVRSQRRCPWTEDPTPQDALPIGVERRSEARIHQKDEARKLLEALRATMSTRSMLMFHALYIEERTVEEVCNEVGVTRNAVYSWRKRLRRQLDELVERFGLEVKL